MRRHLLRRARRHHFPPPPPGSRSTIQSAVSSHCNMNWPGFDTSVMKL